MVNLKEALDRVIKRDLNCHYPPTAVLHALISILCPSVLSHSASVGVDARRRVRL